jgi:hypothetical protein
MSGSAVTLGYVFVAVILIFIWRVGNKMDKH